MKFRLVGYGIAAAVVVVSCMCPMRLTAQESNLKGSMAQAAFKAAEAKPTPRTADGHPDLNGYWDNPQFPKSAHVDGDGNLHIGVPPSNGGTGDPYAAQANPAFHEYPNAPPYKPEFLAKVKYLATHDIESDPEFRCIPNGVPRIGAPRQIVQAPNIAVFLYQDDIAGVASRLIPTDGRPHRTDVDPSYNGDSVGHWEGDTLVIDVNQLSDQTWLAGAHNPGTGYFHSDALHVVERITRKGDTLRWEATVEDPNVLTKPWVITPQTKVLTNDGIYEQPVCEEREAKHIVDKY
jgi:hypothetical protein